MAARLNLSRDSRVVEIASNDGYLLQYFQAKGIPVLGVEPAANVARAAEEKGIPTVVKFFGVQTAREIAAEGVRADLLLGNNVLAHVPDLNDFVAGLKLLLKPRGVLTMEFPHLLRLLQQNQFDTIYHEHFSYFSLLTAERIFAEHGITAVRRGAASDRTAARFASTAATAKTGSPRVSPRIAESEGVRAQRGTRLPAGVRSAFEQRIRETKYSAARFPGSAKAGGQDRRRIRRAR